ncbi:MAG: hypothetical protein ACK4SZ_06695 [Allosphingosinicella sp.]|uniref:hypothetical protein n=1 Tax=Allosphingosinicella sp. TaxID=2823234 RepID=UPI003930CE76
MSQDPRLTAGEFQLRRVLRSASAPPFIAYCEVPVRTQESISAGLGDFVAGKPERMERALEIYPAATTWLMSSTLLRDYGLEGHRIYDPICASFGLSEIQPAARARLNFQFRRACSRLGLIVAGADATGYVDDYILQAGVAKSQLPVLVEAFLRAQAVIGPPPDEDTQRLNAWEVRASDFAHPGFTRLRNIMRWDESAYHAGVFARAMRKQTPENQLEEELFGLVQQTSEQKNFAAGAFSEPLRLLFVEDSLVLAAPATGGVFVELPGRQGEKWIGASRHLNLTPPWPESVRWRREDEDSWLGLPVMPSDTAIVLFNPDDGMLLRRIPVHEQKVVATSVAEVVIVAKTPFRAGAVRSIELGPRAHGLITVVESGGLPLSVGQKEYTLAPPQRPQVELVAPRLARGPGGFLFGAPEAIQVHFANGRPEGALVLNIGHPALPDALVIPIPASDTFRFELEEFARHGPAGPLSASIAFREGNRVLVRSSQWVWPGLKELREGVCLDGPVPPNFSPDESTHLARDPSGRLCLNISEQYRAAVICFAGARGPAVFEINRPGTSLALVDEEGRERPIDEGCRLPVSPGSSTALLIRSDDPGAALEIRGVVHERAFGRSGRRRIALASLAGPAPADTIVLHPKGERTLSRVLVEVSPATSPTEFRVDRERRREGFRVVISLSCDVDAARLVVRNLASNEEVWVDVPLSSREVEFVNAHLLQGEVIRSAPGETTIALHLGPPHSWAGLSIARVEVRQRGTDRWSRLRNSRGDDYLLLPAGDLVDDGQIGAETLFLRLTELLNRCYAPDCWTALERIERLWRRTGSDLALSKGGLRALLRGWGCPVPVDVSATWVPLRHPIEVAPALLESEVIDFYVLDGAGEDFSELEQLRQLAALERAQDAVVELAVNPTFYAAFSNFHYAASNPRARLVGFDMAKFVRDTHDEIVELSAFWKPADRRLTRRHHAWCIGRFIDRYEQVALSGTDANGIRAQRLNQLVHVVHRSERNMSLPAGERLADRLPLVLALPAFVSKMANQARSGRSTAFWDALSSSVDRPLDEILEDVGFLLRLAPELVAFYLLLWELVRRTEPE